MINVIHPDGIIALDLDEVTIFQINDISTKLNQKYCLSTILKSGLFCSLKISENKAELNGLMKSLINLKESHNSDGLVIVSDYEVGLVYDD